MKKEIRDSSNIKEAIKILAEDFNYTEEEILQIFTKNEILSMVDSSNNSDGYIDLHVIEDNSKFSYNKHEFNLVKSCILSAVNSDVFYIKYYAMINGEVYHTGRKVAYNGRRYSIYHSNDKYVYIYDSLMNHKCKHEEVNIIIEDLNVKDTYNLLQIAYSKLKSSKSISLSKFIVIFCDMYDIRLEPAITNLSKQNKVIVREELSKYIYKMDFNPKGKDIHETNLFWNN